MTSVHRCCECLCDKLSLLQYQSTSSIIACKELLRNWPRLRRTMRSHEPRDRRPYVLSFCVVHDAPGCCTPIIKILRSLAVVLNVQTLERAEKNAVSLRWRRGDDATVCGEDSIFAQACFRLSEEYSSKRPGLPSLHLRRRRRRRRTRLWQ